MEGCKSEKYITHKKGNKRKFNPLRKVGQDPGHDLFTTQRMEMSQYDAIKQAS